MKVKEKLGHTGMMGAAGVLVLNLNQILNTSLASHFSVANYDKLVGRILRFGRSEVMFRRVIYISRSLIGADPEGIAAIVSSSIRWNAEVEVTGMLWADGKSFAQVIEGGSDEIGLTMDRIRTDLRHTDVEVLLDRAIVSRQFGNWSMRRAGDDDASAYGTTFMIGFAIGERTASARRLYEIVMSGDAGNAE